MMSLRSLSVSLPLWFTLASYAAWGQTATTFDHQHAAWGRILAAYVNSAGLVNYQALAAKQGEAASLPTYLVDLASVTEADFKQWTRTDQMAFLINAYNAYTIDLILRHYDHGKLKSIKDIGGLFSSPWKQDFFKLLAYQEGGKTHHRLTNLDAIEHDELRAKYHDFRIHAAVNCASISCPQLRREAFVGSKLDAQLSEQMRQWLADPSRNTYDASKGKLALSKIFDWFEKDFGGKNGVKAALKTYGPPAAIEALTRATDIDYLDYNWKLNSQG